LAATIILPGFSQAWRRTGDALSEMLQFHSAIEYYEVAIKLDSSLSPLLSPTIERLRVLERIVGMISSLITSSLYENIREYLTITLLIY
jgi:tetratricopeptide (TPR) repeat protein